MFTNLLQIWIPKFFKYKVWSLCWEGTIFLYISLEVKDIEINKFIGIFSCMFIYVDVFVQQKFHFKEEIDLLFNIYQ